MKGSLNFRLTFVSNNLAAKRCLKLKVEHLRILKWSSIQEKVRLVIEASQSHLLMAMLTEKETHWLLKFFNWIFGLVHLLSSLLSYIPFLFSFSFLYF